MADAVIGVVGGSGLYAIEGLSDVQEVALETPFGSPSDRYLLGVLGGRRVAFLPRHGRGHRLLPSEINFCANIYGFKQLGVRWLLSVSAVGSMREHIAPGEMVVVDQLIDRTCKRRSTFFGEGAVGHLQFAEPICSELAEVLARAGEACGATVHRGGTYLCIEGPQFSTRAESQLYRQWGVDVIGMTNLPEAKLAREAGLCYATLAMATDYDCWYEGHADVTVEAVMQTMARNVGLARAIIARAVGLIGEAPRCGCADAGRRALVTAPEAIGAATREKLALIID